MYRIKIAKGSVSAQLPQLAWYIDARNAGANCIKK
jgi:hypothetical protein